MARAVGTDRELVASTRIACGRARHTVRRYSDGTFAAPDCPRAEAKARALCFQAARGIGPGDQRGCAGLIALAKVLSEVHSDVWAPESWSRLYVRYAANTITRTALALAVRAPGSEPARSAAGDDR